MGQSTTDVKREIEQTREDMSGTIDAIADRTSPSRVLGRQRRRMADRVRSVRSHVMGTAEQAVGTTQEAMHGAREGTGPMADSLRDSAGQMAENVREVPGQARQVVRDQTQGNPLAAGVIAFGTGLLAAYLVPSSPIERRVTKQVRQEAEPVLTGLGDSTSRGTWRRCDAAGAATLQALRRGRGADGIDGREHRRSSVDRGRGPRRTPTVPAPRPPVAVPAIGPAGCARAERWMPRV